MIVEAIHPLINDICIYISMIGGKTCHLYNMHPPAGMLAKPMFMYVCYTFSYHRKLHVALPCGFELHVSVLSRRLVSLFSSKQIYECMIFQQNVACF